MLVINKRIILEIKFKQAAPLIVSATWRARPMHRQTYGRFYRVVQIPVQSLLRSLKFSGNGRGKCLETNDVQSEN